MKLPDPIYYDSMVDNPDLAYVAAKKLNEIIDYLAEMDKQQKEVITRLTNVLLADRPINNERE